MGKIIRVPLTETVPFFKIHGIELDGKVFAMQFEWLERSERWHLHLMQSDETPILMGIKLNINSDLLSQYTIAELPLGKMMLYDTSRKDAECGRNDLGSRCVLLYESIED